MPQHSDDIVFISATPKEEPENQNEENKNEENGTEQLYFNPISDSSGIIEMTGSVVTTENEIQKFELKNDRKLQEREKSTRIERISSKNQNNDGKNEQMMEVQRNVEKIQEILEESGTKCPEKEPKKYKIDFKTEIHSAKDRNANEIKTTAVGLHSESSISFLDLPFCVEPEPKIETHGDKLINTLFLPYYFGLPEIEMFKNINLNTIKGDSDKITIYSIANVQTIENLDFQTLPKRVFWCVNCEAGLDKLELVIKSPNSAIQDKNSNLFPNVPHNLIFFYGLKKYINCVRKHEHKIYLHSLKNKTLNFHDKTSNPIRDIFLSIWALQMRYKVNLIELTTQDEILNIFKNIILFEKKPYYEKIKKKEKESARDYLFSLVDGRGKYNRADFLQKLKDKITKKMS